MRREAPLRKAYLFIKRNRFRKKKQFYKLALALMIDKTIAVYLAVLVIYLFCSFIIFGDFFHEFDNTFLEIERNMRSGFWLILTALPIRYIFKSFRDPGVLFSTSEYQLAMLPYNRKRVWLFTALEKILRQFFTYTIFGSIIILITPISASVIIPYVSLLLFYDIIMTIPQWKLFQMRFLTKVGWFCLIVVINAIGAFINSPIVGFSLVAIIFGVNFTQIHSLFAKVKWDKVTEYSDFRIWNSSLIAKASKVKFKRNIKHGIFGNTKRKKKPFRYTERAIHNRLWKLYFGKSMELIVPFMGALLFMIVVLSFVNNRLFDIGIAVAIYAYSSIASTFFIDRFQADILEILPWDLPSYRKTYFKWVIYGGIPLLLPIIVFHIFNMTLWAPIQLLLYCATFIYIYRTKMEKAAGILAKESVIRNVSEGLGFIFLIIVGFSSYYPALGLTSLLLLLLLKKPMLR